MKTLLAGLLLLSPLVAQKMAVAGGDRVVVVLDVADLLPERRDNPVAESVPDRAAGTHSNLQRLADFVRVFADPPLVAGDDLQPLGDHHLVVLAGPERAAAVETLLAHARQTKAKQFLLDVRICTVPEALFVQHFEKVLPPLAATATELAGTSAADPKLPRVTVLSAEAFQPIFAALAKVVHGKGPGLDILQAPLVLVGTLQNATLAVGDEIAYVRDFDVHVADGAAVTTPIVEKLWHGTRVEAVCSELRDGSVGVQMEVLEQAVEKPIRTIQATVPGSPLVCMVQVPRMTGCRGSQVAMLAQGATAVMAARKSDGNWLVTLMTANAVVESVPMPGVQRR